MFESDVSLEAFNAFATDCNLNGNTIKSIIDHDVEMADAHGEVAFMAHLITVKKSDAVFTKSDILNKDGKNYSLQDVQLDDGILVKISAL